MFYVLSQFKGIFIIFFFAGFSILFIFVYRNRVLFWLFRYVLRVWKPRNYFLINNISVFLSSVNFSNSRVRSSEIRAIFIYVLWTRSFYYYLRCRTASILKMDKIDYTLMEIFYFIFTLKCLDKDICT